MIFSYWLRDMAAAEKKAQWLKRGGPESAIPSLRRVPDGVLHPRQNCSFIPLRS